MTQIKRNARGRKAKLQGARLGRLLSAVPPDALAAEVRATLARRSLRAFTLHTMPGYRVNWHHDLMFRALDRVLRGEVTRLMIFMPPRHGKSEAVSRRFPAYALGRDPKLKIIATAYSSDLAQMANRAVQRIMDAPEYRATFPNTRLNGDNVRTVAGNWLRNSDIFETVGFGGYYRSAGVGGGITGIGADIGIIDDPFKNREEADSATIRERVWDWYTSTFYTRLHKGARVVLTMTRWHEDDLAGRLQRLAEQDPKADRWEVIRLPALAEPNASHPEDERAEGDALWPSEFAAADLQRMRAVAGSRDWNALYQQRPAPDEGAIFKREWFRYWSQSGESVRLDLASGETETVAIGDLRRFVTVDLAVSTKQMADYTVACAWGITPRTNRLVLLDRVRGRVEAPDQPRMIRALYERWQPSFIGVEAVAYQLSLVQLLARSGLPVRALRPDKDKVARAQTAAARLETGFVFWPTAAPWLAEWESELLTFPNAAHDDQVDTLSYAVAHLPSAASSGLPTLDVGTGLRSSPWSV